MRIKTTKSEKTGIKKPSQIEIGKILLIQSNRDYKIILTCTINIKIVNRNGLIKIKMLIFMLEHKAIHKATITTTTIIIIIMQIKIRKINRKDFIIIGRIKFRRRNKKAYKIHCKIQKKV